MKYKFIEGLTSDVMFEAYGKDLAEVFSNAAEAMFSVICQIDKVGDGKAVGAGVEVEVNADNAEELMIKWLQKLILLVDTEEMFFSRFEIIEIDEKGLRAKCYGEEITPEKGETVVKAVTRYNYSFGKGEDGKGYKAVVSLDI